MKNYIMAVVKKTKEGFYYITENSFRENYFETGFFRTKDKAIANFIRLVRDEYDIHWFNPNHDYKMGDTVFDEDDNLMYFQHYQDGKAMIWNNTCKKLVNPEDLRPCRLHGYW